MNSKEIELLKDFVKWLDIDTAVDDFVAVRNKDKGDAPEETLSRLVAAMHDAVTCREEAVKLAYKVGFGDDKDRNEIVLARLSAAEKKFASALDRYLCSKQT